MMLYIVPYFCAGRFFIPYPLRKLCKLCYNIS